MRDVTKLIFRSLDLCGQFYEMYAEAKGFGV